MRELVEQNGQEFDLAETVAHLAARWQSADTGVLRRVFPLLGKGELPNPEKLAVSAGVPLPLAQTALNDPKIGSDDQGCVTEVFGITFHPTLHRLSVGRVQLFSCCALVAHTASRLIGKDVVIESVDPIDRTLVRLEITPDGLRDVDPPEAAASMIRTSTHALSANVAAALCSHVFHFSNRDNAEIFCAKNRARYPVSIETLNRTASEVHRVIWE